MTKMNLKKLINLNENLNIIIPYYYIQKDDTVYQA